MKVKYEKACGNALLLAALNDVNLGTHWFCKCYKGGQKKEATGPYGVSIHRAARTSSGHPRVWAAALSASLRPQSASRCPSLSRFLAQSSVRESLHPRALTAADAGNFGN